MNEARYKELLREWGHKLQANSLAPRAFAALKRRADEATRTALSIMRRENPGFTFDEIFTAQANAHCHDQLDVMQAIALGRLSELGGDPLQFIKVHGRNRARQGLPLSGSLHAYRLAHKVYWAILRDAVTKVAKSKGAEAACLLLLADFLIDYFEAAGNVLTEAYTAEEQMLNAQRVHAEMQLMDDLLKGMAPRDTDAQRLCEQIGFRGNGHMAIVIARPIVTDLDGHGELAQQLRSLPRLMELALSSASLRRLVATRNNEVIAIACGGNGTAKTIADAFRSRVTELRVGRNCFIGVGVSLAAALVEELPQAYEDARRAIDFASQKRPVVHLADIDLMDLLLRRPDTTALRLVPEWMSRFEDEDRNRDGELSRTMRVFTECDMSAKATAAKLRLHTNSVYFRLKQIGEITGVDPRSFSGALLLLTALRLRDAQAKTA